jgi:hypothetical protein
MHKIPATQKSLLSQTVQLAVDRAQFGVKFGEATAGFVLL